MAFSEPIIREVVLTRARAHDPWILSNYQAPLRITAGGIAVPLLIVAGKRRSTRWPSVRARHLREHPACAACGSREQLSVHHIRPYHKFPELELDPDNFITLCEYHNCHLLLGHLCSWYSNNPAVARDAARFLQKIRNRP